MKVLALLDGLEEPISLFSFCRLCVQNGVFSNFRHMGKLGLIVLDEHNKKYKPV